MYAAGTGGCRKKGGGVTLVPETLVPDDSCLVFQKGKHSSVEQPMGLVGILLAALKGDSAVATLVGGVAQLSADLSRAVVAHGTAKGRRKNNYSSLGLMQT